MPAVKLEMPDGRTVVVGPRTAARLQREAAEAKTKKPRLVEPPAPAGEDTRD